MMKWEYSGDDYKGANIYLLKNDDTLEFKGSTEGTSFNCEDGNTYIVRAFNSNNEEKIGKIITIDKNN